MRSPHTNLLSQRAQGAVRGQGQTEAGLGARREKRACRRARCSWVLRRMPARASGLAALRLRIPSIWHGTALAGACVFNSQVEATPGPLVVPPERHTQRPCTCSQAWLYITFSCVAL